MCNTMTLFQMLPLLQGDSSTCTLFYPHFQPFINQMKYTNLKINDSSKHMLVATELYSSQPKFDTVNCQSIKYQCPTLNREV